MSLFIGLKTEYSRWNIKKDNDIVVTKKYGGNVLQITTDSTSIRTDNVTTYDTSTTAVRSDGSRRIYNKRTLL